MARAKSDKVTPPSEVAFSAEWADRICERVADGESVAQIGKDQTFPAKRTIMKWLALNEDFQKLYAVACRFRAEALVEEGKDIIDDGSADYKVATNREGVPYLEVDHEHISRSRERASYRKWMAARLDPQKYGDKVDLHHGGGIALKLEIDNFGLGPPA